MEEEKVIMALDLGSQKIKGLIGTKNDKGGLEIKGKGEIDSDSSKSGISGGLIKNLELTSNNIEKVISNAESHFGKKIEEIWIGFSGKHVDGINEHGSVVISGRDHEVTRDDIERVIVQAKTKVEPLPDSRMVIKEIPRWYKIDGEDMIKRPIGMSGKKLGVKMHLIMSNAQQIKNIEKCVNNVGVYLNDTIPNVLAS
ncbi:MAG TPA: cell division protein FtsA, partial [Candidatus Mcinerneyibacterium sp.]|nr:cell division protein FtsA [Candidatus Mcinerneyibacterium sp.]